MPVYEYACRSCGGRFEQLVRLSERDTIPECPQCGGGAVNKLFSTFAAFSNGAEGTDVRPLGTGCACAAGGTCACG